LRACRRILTDPNDAEDAFQTTFLILVRRAGLNAIGSPESLGPRLHGLALRVARKARVAAARRRRHEGRAISRFGFEYGERQDLVSALRQEVEGLPEVLKSPVVCCYFEGMTYQGADLFP
jgi:DNA-directed RNA polymerase specialized sigma24 family protein